MTRRHPLLLSVLAVVVIGLTPGTSFAKKKKKGGGDAAPADAGGGMTFEPEQIERNKVIEGQSGDDEGNKQRAEFFMGKALFNMKYYSASLSYFDRIVQKGPAHRYYNATLKWLASLSRQLPDSTGVLEKIGKYTRQDLDQPALDS